MTRQKSSKTSKMVEKWKQDGILSGIAALTFSLLAIWLVLTQKNLLLKYSTLGYFGLLVSNFLTSAAVFLPVPTLAASFLSGNVLNPILIGLFAGTGSAMGDFVAYLLGFGARKIVVGVWQKEQKQGRFKIDAGQKKNLKFWFKQNAFLTVFILAFLPNPFFDGVGLLAGVFNMKPRDFLLATTLGRVLRNTILAFSGQKILS
ncbi:MAG: VTT domain-containing protein [Patescibacteria group bacterium]|nr:VTT domain-containing protein [Patescibacteria group bacterium]